MNRKIDSIEIDNLIHTQNIKEISKLCLVTDREILGNRDLNLVIEEAILGGATMIQLREKELCYDEFLSLGKSIKKITDKYSIPLIINDNLQVAQGIDATGVHLGQSDMSVTQARKILGKDKIIGLSVTTEEEAEKAISFSPDYIGIGPIFSTSSKKDASFPLGLEKLKKIINNTDIPTMAIGGINSSNILDVMKSGVDGVAVISEILEKDNIRAATHNMKIEISKSEYISQISENIKNVRTTNPLVLHLTNLVTINDCANVTLAIGGSPLMSFCKEEMEELISISSSVVLNIGTMDSSMRDIAVFMGELCNKYKKPIILDPVGVGASNSRKELVKTLLQNIKFTSIKGNLSEIKTLLDFSKSFGKGVDSIDFGNEEEIGRELAIKYNTVIAITGKVDYIIDKNRVVKIYNGNSSMSKLTGTGCMSTSIIGTLLGISKDNFISVLGGILIMGISGELGSNNYIGNGSLKVQILDNISLFNETILFNNSKIEIGTFL